MRPKVFIGSSKEALHIANAVKKELEESVDVTIWNQNVFSVGKVALDSLLATCKKHEYAVFVLAEDDVSIIRKAVRNTTRDNVIFELGMFTATLGYERCFFLVPDKREDFQIPTDLDGVTYAVYNSRKVKKDPVGALASAVEAIRAGIKDRKSLSGLWRFFRKENDTTKPDGEILISCSGLTASAKLVLFKNRDEDAPTVTRSFRYDGIYRAGHFAFAFEEEDADDRIIGAMVLKAKANGLTMKGQSSFWHHDTGELWNREFELRRPE